MTLAAPRSSPRPPASELSTPYHLAHGLLDYAEELIGRGETTAVAAAVDEATAIAVQLRCRPLLDRAANTPRYGRSR